MNQVDKDMKRVLKELERQGARIEPIKSGRMIYPPDKGKDPVAIHGTPSDRRAWANTLSALRRAGFDI
jgi:hypothetical protein